MPQKGQGIAELLFFAYSDLSFLCYSKIDSSGRIEKNRSDTSSENV